MIRNIGKIRLPYEYCMRGQLPEIFYKLDFTILRAEALAYDGSIEYIGMSPCLDEIPIGVEPPYYKIIGKHTDDGNTFAFEKKEQQ